MKKIIAFITLALFFIASGAPVAKAFVWPPGVEQTSIMVSPLDYQANFQITQATPVTVTNCKCFMGIAYQLAEVNSVMAIPPNIYAKSPEVVYRSGFINNSVLSSPLFKTANSHLSIGKSYTLTGYSAWRTGR